MMQSAWQATGSLPQFPSLKQNISTDVLIIGGGITGLLTAYFLQQQGVPYVLVEKDRICGGTTGNTTAKITYQHGLIYQKILKNAGLETAQAYLAANRMAFEEYAKLCGGIACDYERRDNYVYSVDDARKLEAELIALERIGYPARLRRDLPLPFKTAGAVQFADQAQFHPLKFLAAIADGLNIYENTFVKEMIGCTAVTEHARIQAKKVIVATHFPFLNKHGSYFLKLYQHRSYVIALENAPELHGMFVDDEKTGMSFRNYKDLLFVGGGSHRTGKKGGNWQELRGFSHRYFPAAKEKYYWATQDCMSLDGRPYIGHYSKNTADLYTASGFNKWGMTGAMVAAILLSDRMLDRKNEFAEYFSPSRSILRPQLLLNGFEAVKNLLTPTPKRCPHLGCALKWNAAEHSWDCPCHGSRFTESGKLLDNPANGDLKE